MVKEILVNEIKKIKIYASKNGENISSDKAFNFLILQYFCFQKKYIEECWVEAKECITDGNNDGGIDFVYFDEEETKIVLGQNKYTNQSPVEIAGEIRKIFNTVDDFEKYSTGSYNDKVKNKLQNALDRLTEENEGNIRILFSSINDFDEVSSSKKVKLDENVNIEEIIFNTLEKIESKIIQVSDEIEKVNQATLKIDEAKNWLKYKNDEMEGMFVNVSSNSIVQIYNQYKDKGLFDLNIRKFIKNKMVDEGIVDTLNNHRNEFWFLNNGLTIACEDYMEDGNRIKLYDFSIVNGGQTTNLIGKYKGENVQEFFVPCKIIKKKQKDDAFFSKIAEATNSQKPIQPKDLKSNAPEMTRLKKWLEEELIHLEIKRGEKPKNKNYIKIKNDELAQLIFSFVNQKPGTARSNKNSLFANNKRYSQIFKQGYEKDRRKKDFIIDLIKLNTLYSEVITDLKKEGNLSSEEVNIINNAKQTFFGLFGIIYHIVNGDFTLKEAKADISIVTNFQFKYSSFLSNYKEDDIREIFKELIMLLVGELVREYEDQVEKNKVTSVSNFFKTDKKYLEEIVAKAIVTHFSRRKTYEDELFELGKMFKRA